MSFQDFIESKSKELDVEIPFDFSAGALVEWDKVFEAMYMLLEKKIEIELNAKPKDPPNNYRGSLTGGFDVRWQCDKCGDIDMRNSTAARYVNCLKCEDGVYRLLE